MAVGGTSQAKGGVQACDEGGQHNRVSICSPAQPASRAGPTRGKHRTPASKHVLEHGFAPAYTLLQSLKWCDIAKQCTHLEIRENVALAGRRETARRLR